MCIAVYVGPPLCSFYRSLSIFSHNRHAVEASFMLANVSANTFAVVTLTSSNPSLQSLAALLFVLYVPEKNFDPLPFVWSFSFGFTADLQLNNR
jgi:hypothetical protein